MAKINTHINLIYTYHTPYGIIENGYVGDILKNIFIKSLNEKQEELYSSAFMDYWKFLVKNDKKYKINIVNKETIWKTPSTNDFINIYPIENLNNKYFCIGDEVLKELNNVKNYLFLIIDYDDSISDEFIKNVSDFKKKNKINKNKFLYISSSKKNITEFIQMTSDFDFLKEDLFKHILNKYQKINKNKFI